MSFEKLPAVSEEQIHQGCLNCPPVLQIAEMDMLIAVGFGSATVTKDDELIFMEQPDDDDFHTLQEFEDMAKQDPDHDWRVDLQALLRGRTYQRQGEKQWVLIKSNEGFA